MKKNILSLALLCCVLPLTSCGTTTSGFDTTKNISLYSREAGSGTRECFFEGIDYSEVAKEDAWNEGVKVASQPSNSDMMNKVGQDDYALGYCSLDSLFSVDTIKGLSFEGVEPTEDNVLSGEYELKRNFNYVIRDYTEGDQVKKETVEGFLDFLLNTYEGQEVIQDNGGIVSERTDLKSFDTTKNNYAIFSGTTSVEILFCGSTSVEKIIKAASEKLMSLISNDKVKFTLGQTGSSDAVKGVTTGLTGGKLCDIGFLSREIKEDEKSKLNENNKNGSFAIDAVVPIVNVKNDKIENITAKELKDAFSGNIKTWDDLLK